MHNKKYYIHIFLIVLIALTLLSGCDRLSTIDEINRNLENELGKSVEIVAVEPGITDSGYDINTYKIKYMGLEFTLDNYMYKDSLFGFDSAGFDSDYAYQVYRLFEENIDSIKLKYNLDIKESEYGDIKIHNDVSSFTQLSNGISALTELNSLVSDYIPTNDDGILGFELRLISSTDYDSWQTYIKTRDSFDSEYANYIEQVLKLEIAQSIRDGKTLKFQYTDSELNNIPVGRLDNLYINGMQIKSSRYPIEFFYDIRTSKYYTIVCFGTQLEYNNGVEDYLQREIIEKLYDNSNYEINEEKKETTYNIGEDQYKVKRRGNEIRVYKNLREIEVDTLNTVNEKTPNATYYTWISVDSFAEILGLEVESITNKAVYLHSK